MDKGKSGTIDRCIADDTTVEIIASSEFSLSPSSHRDQSGSHSVGRRKDTAVTGVSIQLVQGMEAGSSGIRSVHSGDVINAGGVEELQTFLNNFNSELAAESHQATVRLIESSSITTSANASYTIYETAAPSTATLVYEDDALLGNATNSATGLQIVEFPNASVMASNSSTFPQDNSAAIGDTSHGEVIFLPQHFQLGHDCHIALSANDNGASTMMGSHFPVSTDQDVQVAISNQHGQQHSDSQQQLLIPIDCTNALVDGNQIPPGSTVLLPVIPTVLANGTVSVRIAGQAIALPTAVTVPAASETTGASADQLPVMVQQQQQQQIVLIVSSSDNGGLTINAAVQETPQKMARVVKSKVTKKQEGTLKKSKNVLPAAHGLEIQSSTSSFDGNLGDETADDQHEKDGASNQPESPKKSTSSADSEHHKSSDSSKRTVFHCEFCDYTNVKKYLLVRHMKSHSEDRPHVCHVCEKRFKASSSLQNHVNTHTGVRPYQCQGCDATFTTSGEMVRHMRYKHTQEKPHKCSHCDYASVELSKLKRHLRSHTGERPYECRKCKYASPDMYKLKRHMRVHTGEKPYECDVCLQRFTQSNSLKAHKLIHTGNKPIYQCEFCSSSCGRKTDLKIHIQKLHTTSERPLVCKKCGKSFEDRYSLKQHQRAHEGERHYACTLCTYSALTQRHLDMHMLVHQGEKPFECPVPSCLHAFRQKTALKRHIEAKHGGKSEEQLLAESGEQQESSVFQCGQCDKKFRHKEALLKHGEQHRLDEDGFLSGPKAEKRSSASTRRGDRAAAPIGFIESENEESSGDEMELEEPELDKSNGSIRLYKCNLCDESFRQLVQLEHHCQLEHIGADDGVSAKSIIYVPNRAIGASTSKSVASASDSADDGGRYDAAISLSTSYDPRSEMNEDTNGKKKRKLGTKALDGLHLKRLKESSAGTRRNPKASRSQAPATPARSTATREETEAERRREVENCFGFADLDSSGNDSGGQKNESGTAETVASTSTDGMQASFESTEAAGADSSGGGEGKNGKNEVNGKITRRSPRKTKSEKAEEGKN